MLLPLHAACCCCCHIPLPASAAAALCSLVLQLVQGPRGQTACCLLPLARPTMCLRFCCAAAVGGLFSPTGPCPLAAAGLLLPADWRDAAVAEGMLLSGSSHAAAWSR